jgi:hypothetical protein
MKFKTSDGDIEFDEKTENGTWFGEQAHQIMYDIWKRERELKVKLSLKQKVVIITNFLREYENV